MEKDKAMFCRINKLRWFSLIFIVAACFIVVRADVFAEQVTLQFFPDQGVWDVTGNYPNNEFDTTNNIDLVQDNKGKITGNGSGTASDSEITINLIYNFIGALKTSNGLARATLTMKISGSATDGSITLPVKGSIKMKLDLDKANNLLIGSSAGNVCVQGRCAKVGGPVQFDIPQPMDGGWTLALDLQSPDNKKIVGTAAATLSNGRVVPFAINGQYTKIPLTLATFQPKFTLKGERGSMTFRPSSHSLSGFVLTKAKLLGQNITTSP